MIVKKNFIFILFLFLFNDIIIRAIIQGGLIMNNENLNNGILEYYHADKKSGGYFIRKNALICEIVLFNDRGEITYSSKEYKNDGKDIGGFKHILYKNKIMQIGNTMADNEDNLPAQNNLAELSNIIAYINNSPYIIDPMILHGWIKKEMNNTEEVIMKLDVKKITADLANNKNVEEIRKLPITNNNNSFCCVGDIDDFNEFIDNIKIYKSVSENFAPILVIIQDNKKIGVIINDKLEEKIQRDEYLYIPGQGDAIKCKYIQANDIFELVVSDGYDITDNNRQSFNKNDLIVGKTYGLELIAYKI